MDLIIDIGEHGSSTIRMKYQDIQLLFAGNVYHTIYSVLIRANPLANYSSPFDVHDIDLTVLREEQFPSCLDNQVMVNQKAEIMNIEEVEELNEKPPQFLEKVLSDQSSIPNLSNSGITHNGCMLIIIERLLYRLNDHLQEYGTSYLWPDSSPEIISFSTQTHVHTGLCCFLHNVLQNGFLILTCNYPSWITTLLHLVPEAFSFRERHDYLSVIQTFSNF